MNILVTGGTGFIGKYLVPALLERGHNVRLLVRDIEKATKLFNEKCEYFEGNITESDSLVGCCRAIDIVFHMVAMVGNQLPSYQNFEAFRLVNVEGTKNIIDESKKGVVSRFIFVSTIAAMGIVKEVPISEESICSPYLPYQVTKYEAEQLILQEFKQCCFPGIIARPTKVYGVGETEYSYLTLAKLCRKGFFPKVGLEENYTSNIYITDLIDGLLKLVDKGKFGETYILTSADSISFIDVGKTIAQTMNKKITIIPIPARIMILIADIEERLFIKLHKNPIVTKRNIQAIISNRIYNISKATKDLEFNPKVSMREGIHKTVNWYMETNII